MNPIRREVQLHLRAGIAREGRPHDGLQERLSDFQVEDRRVSERFGGVNLRRDGRRRETVDDHPVRLGRRCRIYPKVLWTDPEDELLRCGPFERFQESVGDRDAEAPRIEDISVGQVAVDEVDRWAPDEACGERVRRTIVQGLGGVVLLEHALVEERDPVGHGHRFDLVVGHVNRRYPEDLLQFFQLRPHVDPELGVEIAQRLVHEEDLRLADDCAADRDPLPLASTELAGLAPEEGLDLEELGDPVHGRDDLAFRDLRVLEREGHVLVDRHVRVQRVALEHHRDVAILRIEVVHEAVSDVDLAFVRRLESCDAPQGRRLAASARSEEDDELLVLDLEVEDKEFVVLLGPSGCGKTTTLRCVAGLESADEGEIYIGDRLVNDLDPKDRNVAMVFQSYALYPHMTVYQNMAFPLENAKVAEREIIASVNRVAKLLQIETLLGRKPSQLSGGQRQRVAVGRAIVREPQVFLMDEPLSNLDAQLRVHMRAELKKLQKVLGVTTIYVTHDQVEAMTMADRVALLHKGVLQQYDAPQTLYNRPTNSFTASFVGSPPIDLVDCDLADGNVLDAGSFRIPVPDRFLEPLKRTASEKLVLGIRPQDLRVNPTPPTEADGVVVYRFPSTSVPAEIYTTEPLGDSTILDLKVGETLLKAVVGATFAGDTGSKVELHFPPDRIHLFERGSGHAIR